LVGSPDSGKKERINTAAPGLTSTTSDDGQVTPIAGAPGAGSTPGAPGASTSTTAPHGATATTRHPGAVSAAVTTTTTAYISHHAHVSQFPIPTSTGGATEIVAGADGN